MLTFYLVGREGTGFRRALHNEYFEERILIKKILATLDGSEAAESILPYVVALARGCGSEVILAHVVEKPGFLALGTEPDTLISIGGTEEDAQRFGSGYLNQKRLELVELGVDVDTRVLFGHAADAIHELSEVERPDMIAISSRGRSGLARLVLGSVASKLVQTSNSPLMLIHPVEGDVPPVAELREIIVALDTSSTAEAVLPHAREIAKALGLTMTLVMVIPSASQLYLGPELVAHPQDLLARAEELVSMYLRDLAERIQSEDGTPAKWKVLWGDAATEIVELARSTENNMVAMCTHGRSGVGRWVLGSVTDKVVRSSGDPVLVVRPD